MIHIPHTYQKRRPPSFIYWRLRGWLVLIFILGITQFSLAQVEFRSPLDSPFLAYAHFAEFRNDHYHAGIDIPLPMRTPVFAVADGWVSRIRCQPGGYGMVVYLTHPNGKVSVYAHLDAFKAEFEDYFRQQQKLEENYELDHYPPKGLLRVKQGDLIAYSGNSGLSTAPHLHFEFRDEKSESPINPFILGIKVLDTVSPLIQAIKVYGATGQGKILLKQSSGITPVRLDSFGYHLKSGDTLDVPDRFFLGIQARDRNNADDLSGYYRLEVEVDDIPVFESRADSFSFDYNRAINYLTDYRQYVTKKQFFQIIRDPGCTGVGISVTADGKTCIDVSDGKIHRIKMSVSDFWKNASVLQFFVRNKPALDSIRPGATDSDLAGGNDDANPGLKGHHTLVACDRDQWVEYKALKVYFPRLSLFEEFAFSCREGPATLQTWSPEYQINSPEIPCNKEVVISIRADKVPVSEREKACLVRMGKGRIMQYLGGGYANGWVSAATRKPGNCAIAIDQAPPVITRIKTYKKGRKQIKNPKTMLYFKVDDNLSGMGSYCAYLNGSWTMAKYDPFSGKISVDLAGLLKPGNNEFELKVSDKKLNESTFRTTIVD